MTEPHTVGWWLPEPDTYREDNKVRMRFFAGWAVRLVLLANLCFLGLMLSVTDLGMVGALCGAGLFSCGSFLLLGIVIAMAWYW